MFVLLSSVSFYITVFCYSCFYILYCLFMLYSYGCFIKISCFLISAYYLLIIDIDWGFLTTHFCFGAADLIKPNFMYSWSINRNITTVLMQMIFCWRNFKNFPEWVCNVEDENFSPSSAPDNELEKNNI